MKLRLEHFAKDDPAGGQLQEWEENFCKKQNEPK